MKTAFGEYQRLARSALGFSSLWLGEDHLLYVKGSGFLLPFSEEYKRFRYRDIHAIAMAPASGLVMGAIGYFVGLLAAVGLGFVFLLNREPGEWPLLVLTLAGPLPACVFFLVLLIRHLVLGPRCVFELQTALKREPIVTINRKARAREVMGRLSEKIRSAQADLVIRDDGHDAFPGSRRTGQPLEMRIPKTALFSFAGQAALGAVLILLLHLSGIALAGLALLLALASGTPLLAAVAGASRQPTPAPVRQLLWWQLVAEVLLGVVAMVFYIDQAINDPALTVDAIGPLRAFADISALGGFLFYLFFLLIALAQLGIGIAGFVQTRRWSERLAQPISPSSPPEPPSADSSSPAP